MKTFIQYLGYLLLISVLFRFVPIIAAFVYHEPFFNFFVSGLLSFLIGGFLVLMARHWPEKGDAGLTLSRGLMLAAVSFILLPLLGAISFLPSFHYQFLDAAFESFSGFTTTGLTLYLDLDILPKSLLLWRAMTQWIGGVGVVMVFLFIFSRLQSHDYIHMSEIETSAQSTVSLYQSQGFGEKLGGGLRTSVSHVMIIYLGYTLFGISLLLITGMSFYEAVAMTFTALSTGGFSISNTFYSNGWQLAALSFLMLLGAISFIAHNKLVQKKWKAFFLTFEKNVFLLFLLGAILISWVALTDFKLVAFNLISAFTTTGYASSSILLLSPFFIFMLVIGMLAGGNLASTAGGLKTFRIYYLLRAIPWSVKKLSSPAKAIIPLQIHGKHVDEAKLANIGIFIFVYFIILFIGTGLFMAFGHSFLNSSFQMISALGTVGLQTMDLSVLNPFLKLVLMIAMLFGRLEIFPLFILIRSAFK